MIPYGHNNEEEKTADHQWPSMRKLNCYLCTILNLCQDGSKLKIMILERNKLTTLNVVMTPHLILMAQGMIRTTGPW
jgi:hypothetical protein